MKYAGEILLIISYFTFQTKAMEPEQEMFRHVEPPLSELESLLNPSGASLNSLLESSGWLIPDTAPFNEVTTEEITPQKEIELIKKLKRNKRGKFRCIWINCSDSFTHKPNLKRHIAAIHRNIKPFQCDVCNRIGIKRLFAQEVHLEEHLSRHKGFRDYACQSCNITFEEPKALKDHIVTHSNDHLCRLCGQAFSRARTARRHERESCYINEKSILNL